MSVDLNSVLLRASRSFAWHVVVKSPKGPPVSCGESQDDGFGWRATASGLSPTNLGGCASSRLDHGLKTQPGRLR